MNVHRASDARSLFNEVASNLYNLSFSGTSPLSPFIFASRYNAFSVYPVLYKPCCAVPMSWLGSTSETGCWISVSFQCVGW